MEKINPYEVGLANLKVFEEKQSPCSEKMRRYIDIKRQDLTEKSIKFKNKTNKNEKESISVCSDSAQVQAGEPSS